jgi:hypothetical protein
LQAERENEKDNNKEMAESTWIIGSSYSQCLHLWFRLPVNQNIVFAGMVTIFFRIVENIGAKLLYSYN